MQAAMIGLLFTVLLIALVLGYIMFRLSNTPTISDMNKVIDDVNALGDTVTDRILSNTEDVEANKASNENLRGLYDDLLAKSNSNATGIALESSSNQLLLSNVNANTSNIGILTDMSTNYLTEDSLADYVKTTEFDDYMGSYVFSGGVPLGGSATLSLDDNKLRFCSDETTCSDVQLQTPGA